MACSFTWAQLWRQPMSLSFRKHTVQLWKAHKVGFLFSVLKITCMQCNQRKGTCNATTEINVRQVKQMELIGIGGLRGHQLCWDVIWFFGLHGHRLRSIFGSVMPLIGIEPNILRGHTRIKNKWRPNRLRYQKTWR